MFGWNWNLNLNTINCTYWRRFLCCDWKLQITTVPSMGFILCRETQQSDLPIWVSTLVTLGRKGLPFLTRRCLRQNQGLWGEDTCCDRLGMRGGRPDKRHCERVKKMNNGLWHSDKTLIRRKLPAASTYCSVTKGEDSGSPDPVPTICLKSIFLIIYNIMYYI